MKYYSFDEVKQYNCKGDYWIVIDGGVYDLSWWVLYYFGGELLIRYMVGYDCMDVFKVFYLLWVMEKKLFVFKIGEVKNECEKMVEECSLIKDF